MSADRRRGTAKGGARGASGRGAVAGSREAREAAKARGARRSTAASSAGKEPESGGGDARAGWATRLATWLVWALAVVPPFFVSPTAEDVFRLPKTAAAETLALLSLLAIAVGFWNRREMSLADFVRRPATLFAALLAVAVLPGAIAATQPLHWRRATVSLVIALGGLTLWSARLPARSLRRALDLLVLPGAALAVLAVLQARGLFRPFAFAPGNAARFQLTSLAGSVGDLAAFLVLPALVLQAALLRARTLAGRVVAAILFAALAYTLALSQTLAALAAIGVGTLVFWWVALPPRRRWWVAVPIAGAVLAIALVPQLRHRLDGKVYEVKHHEWNSLLSGRPDGWRASLEMVREHPLFGVGNGGYGSSFAPTKLALAERGVDFWASGRSAHFANAHNDYLEALAEWGLWGSLLGIGALAVLARELVRFARGAPPRERALAIAGGVSCGVLALASFPLRIALTAYPWLLLAAWIFAANADADAVAVENGAAADAAPGRVMVPARTVALALGLFLGPVLVVHARTLSSRLEASRIVRTTGEVAQLAMQRGAATARPVLQANLAPLKRAAELDPLEVGIPLTTGSHYLLLGNPAAALEGYQRGLAIEPRAELYLNQARALLMAGRRDQAIESADAAVTLDPANANDAVALGLRAPEAEEERPGRDHHRHRHHDRH